jgi:hypothetical protein
MRMCPYLSTVVFLTCFISSSYCQIVFESLCSTEAEVSGLSSVDGNDEFEIDLYETKFLPDDTILCKHKTVLIDVALIVQLVRLLSGY